MPSQVRLVYVRDADAFSTDLRTDAEGISREFRLVAMTFDRLPNLLSLLEEVVDHLAEAALSIFPDWYGNELSIAEIEPQITDRLPRTVSLAWLKRAERLGRAGRPPVVRDFPLSIQASQLALAIDPSPLLIAMILKDAAPPEGGLLGLARTAEWLASETGGRIVVAVHESLSESAELDGINYEAVGRLGKPCNPVLEPTQSQAMATAAPTQKPKVRVEVVPILGRPHPSSQGEQLLARRLESDPMLAGLFRFNIRVTTPLDSRYLVDLVWEGGKLVVEVDGYEFHSDRRAFSLDRRRDYELMLGGYLVLRLPHDEVIEDVELAVEKIRDVVQFRRSQTKNSASVLHDD